MLASSSVVPEAVDDVKVKAVNEMMERIKHGVVLRPVKGQDTKVMLSVFINWIVYCFVFLYVLIYDLQSFICSACDLLN